MEKKKTTKTAESKETKIEIKAPKSEVRNTLPVYDVEGKVVGQMEVNADLFDKKINESLLAQVVRVYQANQHQGTSKTKTKGEVRGGGRKPWRQKGTGRARTGSIRSAQWRGGGIIFGPTPGKTELKLTKKMRDKALLEALKLKIKEEALVVVNDIKLPEIKTKVAANLVSKLPVKGRTLVLASDKSDTNLKSFRNLANVKLEEARNLNAYDALFFNSLLMSQESLKLTLTKFEKGKEAK